MSMSLQVRNERCELFFEECKDILERKGIDYEVNGDAMEEIYQLARQLKISPAQVIYVYMAKHLSALGNFIERGALVSEGIRERLKDVANYCALMGVVLELQEDEHGRLE